jgi:hypothetical protein
MKNIISFSLILLICVLSSCSESEQPKSDATTLKQQTTPTPAMDWPDRAALSKAQYDSLIQVSLIPEVKGFNSLDSLGLAVFKSLQDSASKDFYDRLPTEAEYSKLHFLFKKHATEQEAKSAASFIALGNVKHIRRWVGYLNKEPYEYDSLLLSDRKDTVGAYVFHRNVMMQIKSNSGESKKIQVFKSILEFNNKYYPWSVADTRG